MTKKLYEFDDAELRKAIDEFYPGDCLGRDCSEYSFCDEHRDAWLRAHEHGERTCDNLTTRTDGFACSECGCEVVGCMLDDFGSFKNPLRFSYCPNCGAKVVK